MRAAREESLEDSHVPVNFEQRPPALPPRPSVAPSLSLLYATRMLQPPVCYSLYLPTPLLPSLLSPPSPFLPLFLFLSLYLSLTRPSLFSRLSVRAPSLCRYFHFYLRTSVSPRDSTVGSVITYVDVAVHDSVEQQWLGIYSIRSPFATVNFLHVSCCIYLRIRSPGK